MPQGVGVQIPLPARLSFPPSQVRFFILPLPVVLSNYEQKLKGLMQPFSLSGRRTWPTYSVSSVLMVVSLSMQMDTTVST